MEREGGGGVSQGVREEYSTILIHINYNTCMHGVCSYRFAFRHKRSEILFLMVSVSSST